MKIYCTLDTETVGGATHPKGIYHLGGIIHDRKGNALGCFNYLIAEWYGEVANDDYAKANMGRYDKMLREGIATLIPTEDAAIAAVKNLCDYLGVTTMTAFNSGFDYCKTKCATLLEGREFVDLFLMAAQILGQQKGYETFCRQHNLLSKSRKSIAMSAESFYAFITNTPHYCEEHTALEDAKIERDIFLACVRQHRAFTANTHFYDYEKKFDLIKKIS